MRLFDLFFEDENVASSHPVLVSVFRKIQKGSNSNAKIYIWKMGPDHFELEVGDTGNRIPVNLSFDKVKSSLINKGFTESKKSFAKALTEGKVYTEGTKVSAKEKVLNPGVEVGKHVFVQAPGFDSIFKAGKFLRIGPSGLATVLLNAPLESNGERRIAVPPSWLYNEIPSAFAKKDKAAIQGGLV